MDPEAGEKFCSNCQRNIKAATFDLHESHCRRHIVYCAECDEGVPRQEFDEHVEECHAPSTCPLCGESVKKHLLDDHQENSCPQSMLECKYCELDKKRCDYEEHLEQCGSRTDFCELCNVRVMLRDMQEHRDMKCGHFKSEAPLDPHTVANLDDPNVYRPVYYSDSPPSYPDSLSSSPPVEGVSVDPQWLESVTGACEGEELDQLLAQNMFYENLRGVGGRRRNVEPGHGHTEPGHGHMEPGHAYVEPGHRHMEPGNAYVEPGHAYVEPGHAHVELGHGCMEPGRGYMEPGHAQDPPQRGREMERALQTEDYSEQFNDRNHPLAYSGQTDSDLAKQLQDEEVRRDKIFERDEKLALKLQQEERKVEDRPLYQDLSRPPYQDLSRPPYQDLSRPPYQDLSRPPYQDLSRPPYQDLSRPPYQDLSRPPYQDLSRSPYHDLSRPPHQDLARPYEHTGSGDIDLARQLQEEEERKDHEYERSFQLAQRLQKDEDTFKPHPPDHTQFMPEKFMGDYQHSNPRLPGNDTYEPVGNGIGPLYTRRKTDEEVARKLQVEEDRLQYTVPDRSHDIYKPRPDVSMYTYDDEEPRPKTPPSRDKEDGGIPCQFCNELFPFDLITHHQSGCTADYDTPTPTTGEERKLSKSTMDRVIRGDDTERDWAPQRTAEHEKECHHCREVYPLSMCVAHEALCTMNPDKQLKNAYPGSDSSPLTLSQAHPPPYTPSQPPSSVPRPSQAHPPPYTPSQARPSPSTPHTDVQAVQPDEDRVPCESCEMLFTLSELHRHQVFCALNMSLPGLPNRSAPKKQQLDINPFAASQSSPPTHSSSSQPTHTPSSQPSHPLHTPSSQPSHPTHSSIRDIPTSHTTSQPSQSPSHSQQQYRETKSGTSRNARKLAIVFPGNHSTTSRDDQTDKQNTTASSSSGYITSRKAGQPKTGNTGLLDRSYHTSDRVVMHTASKTSAKPSRGGAQVKSGASTQNVSKGKARDQHLAPLLSVPGEKIPSRIPRPKSNRDQRSPRVAPGRQRLSNSQLGLSEAGGSPWSSEAL